MLPPTSTRTWEQTVKTIELRSARRKAGLSEHRREVVRAPRSGSRSTPTFTSPDRVDEGEEERDADQREDVEDRRQEHRRAEPAAARPRSASRHRYGLPARARLAVEELQLAALDLRTAGRCRTRRRRWNVAGRRETDLRSVEPAALEAAVEDPLGAEVLLVVRAETRSESVEGAGRHAEPPAGTRCSGRKPTIASGVSTRFIGGEPRNVATKVSAGSS